VSNQSPPLFPCLLVLLTMMRSQCHRHSYNVTIGSSCRLRRHLSTAAVSHCSVCCSITCCNLIILSYCCVGAEFSFFSQIKNIVGYTIVIGSTPFPSLSSSSPSSAPKKQSLGSPCCPSHTGVSSSIILLCYF
jgi:hypothetical protein